MARTRSTAACVFSTKPRIPERRPSSTYCSSVCIVSRISFAVGRVPWIVRAASRPLRIGMRTSRITTSGRSSGVEPDAVIADRAPDVGRSVLDPDDHASRPGVLDDVEHGLLDDAIERGLDDRIETSGGGALDADVQPRALD